MGARRAAYGAAGRLGPCGAARMRCRGSGSWRADGSIAGGGYAALRRALLEGEGIPFTADGRVDMARCAWEIPPQEVHHG